MELLDFNLVTADPDLMKSKAVIRWLHNAEQKIREELIRNGYIFKAKEGDK